MAGTLLRIGDRPNTNICEFCVDTVDEVQLLPTTTKKATGKFANDANFKMNPPIGSTCIVGNGTDEVLVYMLFSNGWKQMWGGTKMDVINYILSKKLKKYVDDSVGNVPDEKITEAVNTYLEENPVQPVDIATVQEANEYLGIL